MVKSKRKPKYIVIHCTATHHNTKVESIQRYWREHLGWKNPGYHRIISSDGTITELAHFDDITNGVRGFNRESIHIAYIGGQIEDDRTLEQKASIIRCIHEAMVYCEKAGVKPKILGHRDFKGVKKDCPQFDAIPEYSWVTD